MCSLVSTLLTVADAEARNDDISSAVTTDPIISSRHLRLFIGSLYGLSWCSPLAFARE
jgi:hypothetical protein